MTGELRFGDGVNGRIPPPGASNLRLARYRTGGGSVGNAAPSTIAQLKTTVPYVDKVGNPEVAAGGAEAETNEAVLERMPRTLRHRGRAVALEDFEDLALLASTEVARARCVPLRDLAADWLGETFAAGAVSVIVVPRSDAAKPLPTETLLERVRAYLAARADATAAVSVVGPAYLKVSVRAEIAVISATAASAVERGVRARLDAFLHPLTGGLDQCGWDFGRSPHRSDFYTLIEQVPGVDHCRRLELEETEDHDGVRRSGRFLVYSGEHVITPVFADT
jgi:predicted phage baseplate assembly protein